MSLRPVNVISTSGRNLKPQWLKTPPIVDTQLTPNQKKAFQLLKKIRV
ncbi:MAG: hypothetical protein KZQ89_18940 [Candidatus Thiodiazotropha sp. (ex Lucinoma kastoroae)]|nr:hypothetical protein [Candidatus Thiodiazotropha sp. (ex Lucinoma kastoroae)]